MNGSVDPLAKYLRRDMLDKIRPEVPPRQERRNEDDSILRDDRVPARPGPYPDPRAMFPGYGQFPQPPFPNYGGADLGEFWEIDGLNKEKPTVLFQVLL